MWVYRVCPETLENFRDTAFQDVDTRHDKSKMKICISYIPLREQNFNFSLCASIAKYALQKLTFH